MTANLDWPHAELHAPILDHLDQVRGYGTTPGAAALAIDADPGDCACLLEHMTESGWLEQGDACPWYRLAGS